MGFGTPTCLQFADFTLCIDSRMLLRDGQPLAIGERAFVLLVTLVQNAGQLVTKEQLIQAAWNGRSVEASNLTVQMAALRRTLGQGNTRGKRGDLIRTVPEQGYIFLAEVTRRSGDAPVVEPLAFSPHPAEPLTLFVGRDSERSALGSLLAGNRNVCVVGIGGVGKTRLVLRLRQELAPAYPDGVVFIDLAPLSDAGQVDEAVAAALGDGSGSGSAVAAIVARLQSRCCLLILDNAEHLSAAVRELLIVVLAGCPALSVLVTSRESLGIPGEAVFRLPPLAVPLISAITASDVLRYDAVRLFADRAQSLMPGFQVDDGNARAVAEICRRLDGIALAIEMAVPRLEVLTLHQLSERLHDRFRVLATPRHQVPARQRTLRAMFDWSWELLSSPERTLLQLVAVFAGGATLGALETLTSRDITAGADIIDLLAALAQKSLLVVSPPPPQAWHPGPRYGVLETTRQYVLEQLATADAAHLHRLHATHFAACFERAEAEWPTAHSATWISHHGPEADNLRTAMRWAFDTEGETELALRLVAHSSLLWWELPGLPLRESRYWHQLAADRIQPRTPARIQARLWLGLSWMDTLDGDIENFPAAQRAVELFREAGDQIWLGAALWRAASTVMFRDNHHPTATSLLMEATRLLHGQPATKWQALCQIRRADLLQHEQALDAALNEYDQALTMVHATGYHYGKMVCGGNRSYLLFKLGRQDEAIAALRSLRRELPLGLSWPLASQLAMLLMAADQQVEALAAALDSLLGTLGTGMLATLSRTLEALALALALSGDSETAALLLGYVLKQHSAERVRLGPRRLVFERLTALLDAALPPEQLAQILEEGRSSTPIEIADMAMRLCRKRLEHFQTRKDDLSV